MDGAAASISCNCPLALQHSYSDVTDDIPTNDCNLPSKTTDNPSPAQHGTIYWFMRTDKLFMVGLMKKNPQRIADLLLEQKDL